MNTGTDQNRTERGGPWALLERDVELTALRTALRAAAGGDGSVTVLEGPAGLGKSRLLGVARDAARAAGMGVLVARGAELERSAALSVALQLLAPPVAASPPERRKRLFDDLAALAAPLVMGAGNPPQDAEALLNGLFWLVVNLTRPPTPAGQPSPLLLTVDDGHWVDEASLRFLQHLAVRVDGLPIALMIAWRTGEPWVEPRLLDSLRTSPTAQVLVPAPLSEAAVAQLTRAAFPSAEGQFVAACVQVTGGNAFFLHELLRSLQADGIPATSAMAAQVRRMVPDSVLRSVLVRLGRFPATVRQLAIAVAVLGDRCSLTMAAALAGLERDAAEAAADALANAHILRPGGPLRFTHPLIGAAVHGDLAAFARAAAHRRAAALLSASGAPVDSIAGHLLVSQPGDDPWVVATLREAAGQSRRRGDPAAAARLLTRAAAEPPPSVVLPAVLVELADAELTAGDPAAEQHIDRALALLTEPGARVPALLLLARLRHAQGDAVGGAHVMEGALALLRDDNPAAGSVLSSYLTATSFTASLRHRADARAAPLLAAARAGRPPKHPALLAHVALRLTLAGDPPEMVNRIGELALAAEPLVEPLSHGVLLGFVVRAFVCVDDLSLAEHAATAALESAELRGAVFAQAYASYHRALARYHRGALAEALDDLDRAAEPLRHGWAPSDGWVGELLAQVHLARGDHDAAREALRSVESASPTAVVHAFVLHARSRMALAERDPRMALRDARAAGHHLAELFGIDCPGLLPWRETAALAAYALGDRSEAVRLAAEALDRARQSGVPRAVGSSLHAAGVVTRGREGLDLLRAAVETLQQSPAALARAGALVSLGGALRRAGHRNEARDPLRLGLELATTMRARPLADRARDELLAAGARPRRTALTGPDALTATERRVARLAARGSTNRQIATALSVSPKTVESHLAQAFRKLGIQARGQLGAALDDAPD